MSIRKDVRDIERSIKGIESNGMILAAVTEDKTKITILNPESDIPTSTKIS